MKTFYFKIGQRELTLEAADVDTAYVFAEAWKEHYNWRGRIIFIGSKG